MQSLNGVNYRIEAGAPLEDLEKIERKQIETEKRGLDTKLKKRINVVAKEIFTKERNLNKKITNAIILHLDGDRKYSQKSDKYYKQ